MRIINNIYMKIETPSEKINKTSKYISSYWGELINNPNKSHENFPVSNPYVSPSKKFNALFYWDNYFVILGLMIEDRYNLAKGSVENFIDEINHLGFIPNYNGPNWISKTRSQPPFFCMMVYEIFCHNDEKELLKSFIEPLKREYQYWTSPPKLYKLGLSRYYDSSFWSKLQPYSTIAESGWDITNRFRNIKKSLPIDLNTLLFLYEKNIPRFMKILNVLDSKKEKDWQELRDQRLKIINKYMWDKNRNYYYDYSIKKKQVERSSSLAGFFPVWSRLVKDEKVHSCVEKLLEFLEPGGFVTTLDNKFDGFWKPLSLLGLQWCYPIGWAPLQWIANKGLCNYNYDKLASKASLRFIEMISDIFIKKGAIFEKFNVIEKSINLKSHYKMHAGFGWTNSIFQTLLVRIILGIEPLFNHRVRFSPRIPPSWQNQSINASFKNYPKLGLDLTLTIDYKEDNKVKYQIELNESYNFKLQFYKNIEEKFDSIMINDEERIGDFDIQKQENKIEKKIIAISKNDIVLKNGQNFILF